MKKVLALVAVAAVATTTLAGCGSAKKGATTYCDELDKVEGGKAITIGMVTDSGTIDDKSFNEGTWSGIKCYESKNTDTKTKYVKPAGEAPTDYLTSIKDLVDNKYQVIVTPGFKFETAIWEAQTKFPDTKFILIDGQPHNGDYNLDIKDNVVSIFFAEHQAGFLSGVAAALNSKTGKLGFIGGMEIPPVQKFGWGYVAGVAYANKTYGTKAQVVDYVYQGSFNNVDAGKALAASMYDKGVDVIFHAAGGVGVGVFSEAKTRAAEGEKVWVVGVDTDQYEAGKYGDGKNSVTLTSAMKRIDVAAYEYAAKFAKGEFPGGKVFTMDITNNGVGLPIENKNMSADSVKKADEVKKAMVDGTIVVPKDATELAAFLTAQGYTSTITKY